MTYELPLNPVLWVGSSHQDLREFPDPFRITWVMRSMWLSEAASTGDAKVLTGFGGAGVREVVKDFRGDTFLNASVSEGTA